jgi:uncharacterized protein YciI
MFYAIMAHDVPNSASKRAATRPDHLAHVKTLMEDGRLLLAGPHPAIDSPEPGSAGMTGSLIVAEFESLQAARAWAEADPYSREGVFESVAVKPFIRVSP